MAIAYNRFDDLNIANCKCNYRFLVSDSIIKKDPIYLELTQKNDTVKINDGSLLTIITVQPYILIEQKKRSYFYYNSSTQNISLLENRKSKANKFQFNMFLYGLNKRDIKSIHIINMPDSKNGQWSDSLQNLHYFVKVNIRNDIKTTSKWFKPHNHSVDKNAFNCSLAILFNKATQQFRKDIIIKHQDGIIGVNDIFLKNDLNHSIKDKFKISLKSDETCHLLPKDRNLIGKQIVVDLWLKSKGHKSKFFLMLKRGETVELDNQEFNNISHKTLLLKLFTHDNFPITVFSKTIEISNFKINQHSVLIDHNEGSILLKDANSTFKKGQKLSFKIKAGNYFPKICHHIVRDKPNIIIRLKKAPVPKAFDNLEQGFLGIVVMDEIGQKPVGSIELFDKNNQLIQTLSQSNFYKTKKDLIIHEIIFKGNDLYDKSHVTVYPQSNNHIVHLFLPRLIKKIWLDIKHNQKKRTDIHFSIMNNNKKYQSKNKPLEIPVYVNEPFQVEINSDKYISAYGQKRLFQCENNFNSCPGFSPGNPIIFHIDKKMIIHPEIKLICKVNGKTKDVYDDVIDEEVKVHIWRAGLNKEIITNKQIEMKYNDTKKAFAASLACPASKKAFTVKVISEKFDNLTKDLELINTSPIDIEMKFNKPVLYMIINPNEEILRGPLHKSKIGNFNRLKNRFYETMSYFDNTEPWDNVFSYNHFFVRYSNKIEELMTPGMIKPKWDDQTVQFKVESKIKPEFDRQPVAYKKLIDEAVQLINKYSISDKIGLKGVIFIVSASSIKPLSTENIDTLQHLLQTKNIGALIARFGIIKDNDFDYTSDKNKYKNITIVEYNLTKEFNNDYFGEAFKKMRKKNWDLIDRNGVRIGQLYE